MPGYSLFLAERHRRRRGYPLILVAVVSCLGCAATGTIAIGKQARARIWNPHAVCPPSGVTDPVTTTSTVHHEDHLVAADVTDTKTVQEPTPVMDSQGSKISDAFGSIFGAMWSGVRWLFGMP